MSGGTEPARAKLRNCVKWSEICGVGQVRNSLRWLMSRPDRPPPVPLEKERREERTSSELTCMGAKGHGDGRGGRGTPGGCKACNCAVTWGEGGATPREESAFTALLYWP